MRITQIGPYIFDAGNPNVGSEIASLQTHRQWGRSNLALEVNRPLSPGRSPRGAFTLVEMLVAVGLVVLMMTLFATIFGMATSAMSTQKGLAENDQHDRLVLTRLRNDLHGTISQDPNDPNRPNRTFGYLVPWGPDELSAGIVTDGVNTYSSSDRKGYFYISENDPNDDTDDVLALTVMLSASAPELLRQGRRRISGFTTAVGTEQLWNPGNPVPLEPIPKGVHIRPLLWRPSTSAWPAR